MTDKPNFEPRTTARATFLSETLTSLPSASPFRVREGLAAMRVALLTAVAIICTGLVGMPSAAQAASPQARPANPPITWKSCTAAEFLGLDCGTISVPVDWSAATGEKVTLTLVRRRADDKERSIGTLMLNNGGGSSTIEQLTAAGCIGWPNRPDTVLSAVAVPDAPPTLILQSTHQSLAPYTGGFGLARQLPGSVVLTREGDDYSMVIWSECVRRVSDAFLVGGELPKPGTTCTD